MLWTLPSALFLLAGAIPLIVFLHSLKPRGLKVATTTLFLWERILRERPLGTRLGWLLRHNVLLLLQILAAVALIIALADPALLHFGSSAGDLIVVIDLSASMRKIIETQTRTDFLADGDSVKVVADVIGRDGKFMRKMQGRGQKRRRGMSCVLAGFFRSCVAGNLAISSSNQRIYWRCVWRFAMALMQSSRTSSA